jgi:hypothetical protein
MRQLQISRRQRAASARRRAQPDTLLPLDPRDPDIVRAKQLQRQRTASPAGPAERSATGRVRTPGT